MGLDYFRKACANARKCFSRQDTQPKKRRKHKMGQKYLFIIMGPAGCGKSTVARHLSEVKGWKYIEGDDHHSAFNKAKMQNSNRLTDEDRKPWLAAISNAAISNLRSSSTSVVVASCSALKVKYRDQVRAAVATANATAQDHIKTSFIYLRMEEELARELVAERHEEERHFMPPEGVRKQYEDLQEPGEGERDVFVVDANQGKGEVMDEAVRIAESLL